MPFRLEALVAEPDVWRAVGVDRQGNEVYRRTWETFESACDAAARVTRTPQMMKLRVRDASAPEPEQ